MKSLKDYRITVLKETPFHSCNDVITFEEYISVYSCPAEEEINDAVLNNRINDILPKDWFKVSGNKFKVGDWVWHTELRKALVISDDSYSRSWVPNSCSLDAVMENLDIYQRLATPDEIENNYLHSFCNGKLLIGRSDCYYFDNIWRKIEDVKSLVYTLLPLIKNYKSNMLDSITVKGHDYTTTYDPSIVLMVGCIKVHINDLIKIANIFKML